MSENLTQALLDAHQDDVYYTLTMFPYPSGYGLHAGHASVFTINDINARYQRMKGKVVLNPFGFDSFGLPTENYAMQQGKPARQVTKENGEFFLKQIAALDLSFDMDRVFYTSDPEYYKRTQWIFLKLYDAGLVYRDEKFVNRCPDCMTVLANDQVVDGLCERCKAEIIQQKHPQRFIKITDYADRLLADLDLIDRPEETKQAQRNWIGKSVGTEVDFIVQETTKITCFTTRIDTLYGVTAVVLAPESTLIDEYLDDNHREKVFTYRKDSMSKTAVQRQQDTKDKTGVFSGVYAVHPLTGELVPVWFADYVLMDYGTGAVMFVPAHDERDREFAQVHGLVVKQVIQGDDGVEGCYTGTGHLINSGLFDGLDTQTVKEKITKHLEQLGLGTAKITYKLRDRSVSRQRYRGSPIPMYYEYATKQVPYLKYTNTERAFRDGLPIVNRTTVRGFVFDTKTQKYCILYRKSRDIYMFPSGGIDDGETLQQGLKREILEETGYSDIKILGLVGEFIEDFYAVPKQRNQHIQMSVFSCELLSDDNQGHAREAHEDFDVLWLSAEEIYQLPGIPVTTMYCFKKYTGVDIVREGQYSNWIDKDKKIFHPVPYSELPVVLPLDIENYKPKGKSPLEDHASFPMYTIDTEKVPLFVYKYGRNAVQPGIVTVSKLRVLGLIKNTITGKYLCIKYVYNDGLSCITGGVDAGESLEDALKREIYEESGISNLYNIHNTGKAFQSHFFKFRKEENSYTHTIMFTADTDQKVLSISDEEASTQTPLRLSIDEIVEIVSNGMHDPLMNGFSTMNFVLDYVLNRKPEYEVMVNKVNDYTKELFGHKPKVLLIHGRGNNQGDGSCLDALANLYKENGYEVIYPKLTYDYDYDFDKAIQDLLKYDANIVVGHSAGGYLALHYASQKKPSKIVLISPTCESYCGIGKEIDGKIIPMEGTDCVYSNFIVEKIYDRLGESGGEKYMQFHNHAVDYTWLKDKKVEIYMGENDNRMESSKEWYGENNKDLVILKNRGHMGSGENNKNYGDLIALLQIPEIGERKEYRRECDTLDTFMCSSFYFLRFPDAHNPDELIRKEFANKMLPINLYTGGKEHTVGHLLYSRFIHKFLYDQGYVSTPEPFAKLVHQGYILGPDGRKMGKRYGNVIDPIDVVNQYGSDAIRTYMMFMGPVDQDKVRNDNALKGIKRFLDRIIKISTDVGDGKNKHLETTVHRTIKGMTYDLEQMKYNTAVSKLMILLNAMEDTIKQGIQLSYRVLEQYALMLAPFAPKTAQFVRERTGHDSDVSKQSRPAYDPDMVVDEEVIIPVQINGKRKAELSAPVGSSEDEIMDLFQADESYSKYIGTAPIKKIIWVQDKILNIVV